MKTLLIAALLASGAIAAPADFQGIIDMDLSLATGKGRLNMKVGATGTRIDMNLEVKPLPQPIKLAIVLKNDDMKTLYMISDVMKSYSEFDIGDKMQAPADGGPPYVIKVMGTEKRLGYNTSVVELTRTGEHIKLWVSKEIGIYSIFKKLQAANPQLGGQAEIFSTLEKSGHAGFPLKSIITRDGETVTMEVKKVEKKPISVAEVSVPVGYSKSELPAAAAGGAMPKISPEQMEQMKKMLQDALKGQQ